MYYEVLGCIMMSQGVHDVLWCIMKYVLWCMTAHDVMMSVLIMAMRMAIMMKHVVWCIVGLWWPLWCLCWWFWRVFVGGWLLTMLLVMADDDDHIHRRRYLDRHHVVGLRSLVSFVDRVLRTTNWGPNNWWWFWCGSVLSSCCCGCSSRVDDSVRCV